MIAVNKRTALTMFWQAGFNTEDLLIQANSRLETLAQPTRGYYLASDVSKAIQAPAIGLDEQTEFELAIYGIQL